MNSIQGTIQTIITEGNLSLISLKAMDTDFTSIVIDTPETEKNLREGREVSILFKESEVILAKDMQGTISTQNVLACEVIAIEKGRLLTEVTLSFHGKELKSFITSKSAEAMSIQAGDAIQALIKTNEVILSYDD